MLLNSYKFLCTSIYIQLLIHTISKSCWVFVISWRCTTNRLYRKYNLKNPQ